MRIQVLICVLPLLVVLVASGCGTGARTAAPPAPPESAGARRLLADVKDLEHSLGLAIIAASPGPRRGFSGSVRGAAQAIAEAEREIEFLEAGGPSAAQITRARVALEAFVRAPSAQTWRNSWQHLQAAVALLRRYVGSDLWRAEVPPAASQRVQDLLDRVGRSSNSNST